MLIGLLILAGVAIALFVVAMFVAGLGEAWKHNKAEMATVVGGSTIVSALITAAIAPRVDTALIVGLSVGVFVVLMYAWEGDSFF